MRQCCGINFIIESAVLGQENKVGGSTYVCVSVHYWIWCPNGWSDRDRERIVRRIGTPERQWCQTNIILACQGKIYKAIQIIFICLGSKVFAKLDSLLNGVLCLQIRIIIATKTGLTQAYFCDLHYSPLAPISFDLTYSAMVIFHPIPAYAPCTDTHALTIKYRVNPGSAGYPSRLLSRAEGVGQNNHWQPMKNSKGIKKRKSRSMSLKVRFRNYASLSRSYQY